MGRTAKPRRPAAQADAGRHRQAAVAPAGGTRHAVLAVCGLLLLAVVVVFGQTAGFDFVSLDDGEYVLENPRVMAGLSPAGVAWAFAETRVSSQWQPLTLLSLMADVQAWRWATPRADPADPADRARLASRMHVTNVALHAANVLLLFLVLRSMTGTLWRSAFVAALFAVHPLHVESVAWITERKDVLSGLFGLLAIGAYARYARRPSPVRYLLVFLSLALGLMAKPMLVTWPLVFLLLDIWPLDRLAWKHAPIAGAPGGEPCRPRGPDSPPRSGPVRLVVEKLPLLLLVAASAALTLSAQRAGGALISLERVALPARIGRAATLSVAYLGRSLWPANLACLPVYDEAPLPTSAWVTAGAFLLLACCSGAALWGARRGQRWLAVGWLWYLITLVPVIGIVQSNLQVMADRFVYLPQIGLAVVAVWGAAALIVAAERRPAPAWLRGQGGPGPGRARWIGGALAALAVAALTICARRQATHWRDSETLWTRTAACVPGSAMAHYNLGRVCADGGRTAAAVAHYRRALEIRPDYVEARFNLGTLLARQGQAEAAIDEYQRVLAADPDHAFAHNDLGVLLAERGAVDEAIAHYFRAIEIRPERLDSHTNLGAALAARGRLDEAVATYRRALEVGGDDARIRSNLGNALARLGRPDEAIVEYRLALEASPDSAEARYNLGNVLAAHPRHGSAAAIAEYRRALALRPDYAEAHNNLAVALAGRGEIDEAVVHFRKALAIDPGYADARRNLDTILARPR